MDALPAAESSLIGTQPDSATGQRAHALIAAPAGSAVIRPGRQQTWATHR